MTDLPPGTRVRYDVPDDHEDTTGTVAGAPDHQGATPVRWDDTGEVEAVHADVLVPINVEHRDTHQTYDAVTDPHDAFVTHCTCGYTTRGMDPDDADAKMLAHTNPEGN